MSEGISTTIKWLTLDMSNKLKKKCVKSIIYNTMNTFPNLNTCTFIILHYFDIKICILSTEGKETKNSSFIFVGHFFLMST